MQATLQVKVTLEKANHISRRLKELHKAARARRQSLEEAHAAMESEEMRAKFEERVGHAREVEDAVSTTNLMRAMLDFATENLLTRGNDAVLEALHASSVARGAPKKGELR